MKTGRLKNCDETDDLTASPVAIFETSLPTIPTGADAAKKTPLHTVPPGNSRKNSLTAMKQQEQADDTNGKTR